MTVVELLAFSFTSLLILLPFPFYWFLWTHPQAWVDFCSSHGRAAAAATGGGGGGGGGGDDDDGDEDAISQVLVDPCHRMAQVSHLLKLAQLLALASTASSFPSWPPPLFSILLLLAGQYLNLRVYQLLGEDGVYYGVRFGKQIPWVQKFPFGYIRDPQYVGSSLSLLGCLYWVQWPYVVIWILGYLFLSHVESVEDVTSRAKLPKALKT